MNLAESQIKKIVEEEIEKIIEQGFLDRFTKAGRDRRRVSKSIGKAGKVGADTERERLVQLARQRKQTEKIIQIYTNRLVDLLEKEYGEFDSRFNELVKSYEGQRITNNIDTPQAKHLTNLFTKLRGQVKSTHVKIINYIEDKIKADLEAIVRAGKDSGRTPRTSRAPASVTRRTRQPSNIPYVGRAGTPTSVTGRFRAPTE